MSFKRFKRSQAGENWGPFILVCDLFIYLFILQHKYKYLQQRMTMTRCSPKVGPKANSVFGSDDSLCAVTILQHHGRLFTASVDGFTP